MSDVRTDPGPGGGVRELGERLRACRDAGDPVEAGVAEAARFGAGLDAAIHALADEAALEDDPTWHSILVAIHDVATSRSMLRDCATGRIFDESFYVRRHPDIAAAVQAGNLADGFTHFVRHGAVEGRAAHAWRPVGRASDRAVRWTRVGDVGVAELAAGERRVAMNFIGFLSSNMGLGVTARNFIRLFDDAGFDLHLVDLPLPFGRSRHDLGQGHRFASVHEPSPHRVNFFVMSLQDVRDQLGRGFAALDLTGRINVALPFWELPRLPPACVSVLDQLDVVLAASDFVRDQLKAEAHCPPVVEIGHPLYLPQGVAADRARFGIPADRVAFLASFDLSSDTARKNPFAALTAFERAFSGDDRACFVVKVNSHREPSAREAPHLARLVEAVSRVPNARLVHEILGYADVMSLCASCDALVSLHRAEGLGLCLMEAMSLGKPVIATGWSGNTSYANQDNSCPVDFDLVPVRSETQAAYDACNLAPGSVWAEPAIEHAARWMRTLVDAPALRARIGAKARADMIAYQRRIGLGELVAAIRTAAARCGVALN
ncbi:MAG: glycosyltransferase [Planctomycetes bacterium]|nr:glycosyltransferase [Planctomycetota bacterium]